MSFKIFAAALATAAFVQPASAQTAAPVNGPRVEARVGLDRVRIKSTFDDGVDAISDSAHEDGVVFGGEFGYDRTVGNGLVFGAYAGVDFSTTEYCSEVYGGDEGCLDAGRNITLGLRAGANLSPTILAYAKGGFSNGRVTASYDDGVDSYKVAENRDGFHLGVGLEANFKSNTYVKAEYVYTDYEDFGADFDGLSFGIEPSRHQLLTGVGIRF